MLSTESGPAGATQSEAPGRLRRWAIHVGVPLLMVVAVVVTARIGGDFKQMVLDSEIGVRESLTGLLALAAAIVSFVVLFQRPVRCDRKVKAWVILYLLAMIYFFGEDLNWGQHYFGWQTPEFLQEHNRENEINLHNVNPWFNQKPRMVVELWFLVAGILVPLGWRLPVRLARFFVPEVFWPDRRLVVVSALALFMKVPRWLEVEALGEDMWIASFRYSEVQELFFAYGMLLYALLLLERLREPAR